MKYTVSVVKQYWWSQGIPLPQVEARLIPHRKFRWDFAWPEYRLALEVQGGVWSGGSHGRGSGIVRDHEKSNLIARQGWRTLYVVPKELCLMDTVEMIREAILA